MASFAEMMKKEQATKAQQKAESEISSFDTLMDNYFEAKKTGGQSFYDFIQRNKANLQTLFSDSPNELKYISLIPSLGEDVTEEERKELNKKFREDPVTSDIKIAAKDKSIKSEREKFRPDLAKLIKDEKLFDTAVRADLKRKGFLNPTDEEVENVKKQIQENTERVQKANEYEEKPTWQKIGYSIAFPRAAESRAMGYEPTAKDFLADIGELSVTTFTPGLTLKALQRIPKATETAYKIGKVVDKAASTTSGIPGANVIGDVAGKVGRVGIPETAASIGVDVADLNLYDDERERGKRSGMDIFGRGLQAGVIAGLIGGGKNLLTPEQQKTLSKADEAIAHNVVLKPRQGFLKDKGRISAFDDPRIKDYQQYRTFEKASTVEPSDIMSHDTMKNNRFIDELAGEASKETIGLRGIGYKDQIDDYVKATGKDYISAIDDIISEMQKGRFDSKFTNDKDRIAFYNELVNKRNELLKNYYKEGFTRGVLLGGVSYTAKERGSETYKHLNEDRGNE